MTAAKPYPQQLPLRYLPLPPPLLLLLLLLLLFASNIVLSLAQQPPRGSFSGGSVEWALLPVDASGGGRTVEFYIRTHWQRTFSAFKVTRDG